MEGDGLHAEGIASYHADVTWGYRRRSFVGELPRWGGAAVMDLSEERRYQHLLWLVASAVMSSLLSRWG